MHFLAIGYAIIQLPEFMRSSVKTLKNILTRNGNVGPNKLDMRSLPSSHRNADSTILTIKRTNHTDTDFSKLIAIIDNRIDQKFKRERQQKFELTNKRFDVIPFKSWGDNN